MIVRILALQRSQQLSGVAVDVAERPGSAGCKLPLDRKKR